MTSARPDSTTIEMIRVSCSESVSLASTRTTATSARSRAVWVRAPADACGVDEAPLAAAELHDLVDRVARGAGDRVDDDPLRPGELVEQRGLADVGPSEQRNPARPTGLVEALLRGLGQRGEYG